MSVEPDRKGRNMRTKWSIGVATLVLGIAVGSGVAAAAAPTVCSPPCDAGQSCVSGACTTATGGAPDAASAGPPPGVAAPAARVPAAVAPRWHEGVLFLPSLGLNSFQGDSGQNRGVGFRASFILGSRMAENWSMNVGFIGDQVNLHTTPGGSASDYFIDLAFSPLLHFPQEKLEIVVGPMLGTFLEKGSSSSGLQSTDRWSYGWDFGANLGLLFPVGAKAEVGGLLSFLIRDPAKICLTTAGNETCLSSGLTSAKTLGFALAAMF